MREITKADMDKPIEPKMAPADDAAASDGAKFADGGTLRVGVKKAVERMTQEKDDEV